MALIRRNIDALVGAARADVLIGAIFTTDHRAQRLAAAEALLIKGISIAPRNYWAHLWLGFHRDPNQSRFASDRRIGAGADAQPEPRRSACVEGQAKITMGRAEEAEAHVNEAFRLSPNDAVAFMWTHIRGLAKFHLGADEEAVALFRRSVDASRNHPLYHSIWRPRSRISIVSMRLEPKSKLAWPSLQDTRSPAFKPWRKATIQPISRSASASSRGSA